MPKVVLDALIEHKERQDEARKRAGSKWIENNLVFCNRTGGYVQPGYVRLRFHELLVKVGLPDIRFHDLRHRAATILLTMGIHPKVVQELLGHSSIAITMNVYSHLLPSMQENAMGMVNDVFENGKSKNDEHL